MSLCSLIMTHQKIEIIVKDRYHKHELVYAKKSIFIYSRIGGNILSPEQKLSMSYYEFLLKLRQFSSPLFITIGELHHRQSELDFAIKIMQQINSQNTKEQLNQDTLIEYDTIYTIYQEN